MTPPKYPSIALEKGARRLPGTPLLHIRENRRPYFVRSITMAMPWPTPMHMETSA